MRVGMGLIKNEHGVFHVRRKMPKALEVATARVLGVTKDRVSWLKKSLATNVVGPAELRERLVATVRDTVRLYVG